MRLSRSQATFAHRWRLMIIDNDVESVLPTQNLKIDRPSIYYKIAILTVQKLKIFKYYLSICI